MKTQKSHRSGHIVISLLTVSDWYGKDIASQSRQMIQPKDYVVATWSDYDGHLDAKETIAIFRKYGDAKTVYKRRVNKINKKSLKSSVTII